VSKQHLVGTILTSVGEALVTVGNSLTNENNNKKK